jgi:hypothetical protein
MKQLVRTLLLGTAMVAGTATWAAAQAVVLPVQWGHRDADDRQAFQDGYRQGQLDARQGRRSDWDDRCRYREADDRAAFRDGYNRGYREVGYRGANDGYYGNRGPYGRYGPYGGYGNGSNVAERFGFQDGLNAGAYDRQTGHSYRPEHDGGYKHADNGYDSRFGNKDTYKYYYRQAYMRGYQQGYNGGGWRRY